VDLEAGFKTDVSFAIPSVEDVEAMYHPPLAAFSEIGQTGKELVAIGTAVYQAVIPSAYNSHLNMMARTAWDWGPGNVWILAARERLTYPYAPLFALAGLFKTERKTGRKADWFFWADDDVVVPANVVTALREAADPETRPFVAAVGHDRYPPFRAAVWDLQQNAEGLFWRRQWEDGPESGTHLVETTGLCAAIFHRSFFDRVPQPWFAAIPPVVDADGGVSCRINPDAWLCQQCHDAGVPIHVSCDVHIMHMGLRMPLNRESAKILRKIFAKPQ